MPRFFSIHTQIPQMADYNQRVYFLSPPQKELFMLTEMKSLTNKQETKTSKQTEKTLKELKKAANKNKKRKRHL